MAKGKKWPIPRIVGNDGEPCPRCGRLSEIREHKGITPKLLRQPFYFSRWFNCTHGDCRTTIFMLDEFKVYNDNPAYPDRPEKRILSDDDNPLDIVLQVLDELSNQPRASDKPPWED